MGRLQFLDKVSTKDTLRVNPSKNRVELTAGMYKITEKNDHIILYIPSLNLSGYGDSVDEAREMLQFSLDEYFNYFFKLSRKQQAEELQNKGWNKVWLSSKEFSKVHVNINGELEGYADAAKIEFLTVEA